MEQAEELRAFARQLDIVIIVNQDGFRVREMGAIKSLGDEFLTEDAGPFGQPEVSIAIVEGLVDDIPGDEFPTITSSHGLNVRLHPAQQRLAVYQIRAVPENPFRSALILGPNQAVAAGFKPVSQGKADKRICQAKIKLSLRPLHSRHLQAVGGYNRSELLADGVAFGRAVVFRRISV